MRLFWHELKGELLLYTRSRELAFFTFLLPMIFFVLLGSTYGNDTVDGVRGSDFLLAGMIGLSIYHDFIAGPRLRFLSPQNPAYVRLTARMRWSERLSLVLGLAVLFFALGLRRL